MEINVTRRPEKREEEAPHFYLRLPHQRKEGEISLPAGEGKEGVSDKYRGKKLYGGKERKGKGVTYVGREGVKPKRK